MNITTQRLHIRKFEIQDWQAVVNYMSDQTVMHYMPEGVLTAQQVQKFISDNRDEAKHFAIVYARKVMGESMIEAGFLTGTSSIVNAKWQQPINRVISS
ncbi:N-acetyltransferase OS=Lysinibacillus sphaericus OX=1421 GN=LS41612_16850 PE=4 SV=1 [Lysinibacillus sphaericus]